MTFLQISHIDYIIFNQLGRKQDSVDVDENCQYFQLTNKIIRSIIKILLKYINVVTAMLNS